MLRDLSEIADKLRKNGVHKTYVGDIIKYLEILSIYVDITGVLLYGSVVYGRPRISSDIDIIVVSPNFDCSYTEKILLNRKISPRRPPRISAVWVGEREIEEAFQGFTGFLLDALFFGLILYDEKNILTGLRKRLEKALNNGKIERRLNMWRIPIEMGVEEIIL